MLVAFMLSLVVPLVGLVYLVAMPLYGLVVAVRALLGKDVDDGQ